MKIPAARKLPSGSWFIQLRLGGESISVTEPTERECIRQAQYIKSEYLAGKRERSSDKLPTLSQAIDAYIEAKSNILSPSTIRGYRAIQKGRFQGMMDRSISDVSDAEWIQACNQEAALCSAKTLTNAWRFLATVIRFVDGTPPTVSLPQVIRNEHPFLDPPQIIQFLEAIRGTEVEIAALLALHSLRRSEICALTWENIDLKKRTIFVRGAVVYDEHGKVVRKLENKNQSSARYVPIMIDRLYELLASQQQPSGVVVTCSLDATRDRVNQVCKKAGLPLVGAHGLRHSFASLAYHLGIPEMVTMRLGGWKDNQTVQRIYTHIAEQDMSDYAQRMIDFYKNANKIAK